MAYPASEMLKIKAVEELDSSSLRLKSLAQTLKSKSLAGPVDAIEFDNFMGLLSRYIDRVDEISLIPEIDDLINSQKPNYSGNPSSEALVMRNAAISLRNWLFAVLENASIYGGTDLYGVRVPLSYTVAETEEFRTRVDAFTLTIG